MTAHQSHESQHLKLSNLHDQRSQVWVDSIEEWLTDGTNVHLSIAKQPAEQHNTHQLTTNITSNSAAARGNIDNIGYIWSFTMPIDCSLTRSVFSIAHSMAFPHATGSLLPYWVNAELKCTKHGCNDLHRLHEDDHNDQCEIHSLNGIL